MARTAEDSKKFGEDIAFGIQQTLACWATDFIDPYVGAKIQQKMEPDVGDEKELKHAWIGEIVGDTAALFVFLGVQRFIPQPVQWFKGIVKSLGDGFLEKSGRKTQRGCRLARVHEKTGRVERIPGR